MFPGCMLHAAQKNCLAFARKTTQRHCGHNLSQFCDSFFHAVHEKWAEKSKKTERKAAAKSCQSMDTFVRKLPRQESAVREDTPAAEVYRENLEGKSKISRLLFSEILCEHQLQNILF